MLESLYVTHRVSRFYLIMNKWKDKLQVFFTVLLHTYCLLADGIVNFLLKTQFNAVIMMIMQWTAWVMRATEAGELTVCVRVVDDVQKQLSEWTSTGLTCRRRLIYWRLTIARSASNRLLESTRFVSHATAPRSTSLPQLSVKFTSFVYEYWIFSHF